MITLDIKLKAENSSGEQQLFLTAHDDGTCNFTLCGYYDDSPIQIDFDEMRPVELAELHLMIGLILEEMHQGHRL